MDTAEQPLLLVVDTPAKVGAVLEGLSRAGFKARLAQHADVENVSLAGSPRENPPGHESDSAQSLESVERRHIIAVLKRTHGVIEGPRGAAVVLKLKPSTTRFRMKKLGITKSDYVLRDEASHS